jgi:hypothetical protein
VELPKKSKSTAVNGVRPQPSFKELAVWGQRSRISALAWQEVDSRYLLAALSAISAHDGALMFGTAMGGRGVVLTLYIGGDRGKTYVATVGELENALLECAEALASPSEDWRTIFGLPAE